MRNEAHLEALRAAARLTLGAAAALAVLGGCTAPTDASDDAASSTSDVTTKKPSSKKGKDGGAAVAEPGSACHLDAGAPKQTCDQILASTFPDAGGWPGGDDVKLSKDAEACCIEAIKHVSAEGFNDSAYRWSCCAATNWGAGIEGIGVACTPWGPPVPPAMKRRARPVTPIDAWLVEGVA